MACLFCQQTDGHLHEVRTLGADENIRQMASELHDTELMARMEGGNLITLDAKYHRECLTTLQNRYRSLLRQHEKDSSGSAEEVMKARALAELFTHVENCVEDGTFHFKFSVLHQLYEKSPSQHPGLRNKQNLFQGESSCVLPTSTRAK